MRNRFKKATMDRAISSRKNQHGARNITFIYHDLSAKNSQQIT